MPADSVEILHSGQMTVTYQKIASLEELAQMFSRADDDIRALREQSFETRRFKARSRIGQGVHDRAEKIIFSHGASLSESDRNGLKRHQPHCVKVVSARQLTLEAGECWDFTAYPTDFGLERYDDLLCSVHIGKLILEEGASICIRGNLFSFYIDKVIKKGHGTAGDIVILPTAYSYMTGFCGSFAGSDGENGSRGANGHDAQTPAAENCLLGRLHFGHERGVKNGEDGEAGGDGTDGSNGFCGGAVKNGEIFINSIELSGGVPLYIIAQGGNGGAGRHGKA